MKNFTAIKDPVVHILTYSIMAVIILCATVVVAHYVRKIFTRLFETDADGNRIKASQYSFLKHLITALVYIVGVGLAVSLIPPLRSISISLFAGSGILAIIIGFAAQHSFANIVSGIFITIFKPFRIGDRVKMLGKDIAGVVEDITLRHTIIRTFENKRVVIPNSVISTELVENANLIDEKICKLIDMGISYGSDVKKAKRIMQEEAEKHPLTIDNRDDVQKENGDPVVMTRVIGFADSSVTLRAWVWTKDQPSAFQLGCELYESIKERFDAEGVEIPFPHRKIVR